jgi:hypothetical protein
MIKKNLVFILVSVVCAGLNLYGWQITLKLDTQLAWVALVLVFLNLLLSWLVWRRNKYISILFMGSSFIIEALIFINFFWMQKVGRTL